MKRLQLTRYITYSRTNLKKNRVLFLFFILLFPLYNIPAMNVSYELDNTLLSFSINASPMKTTSLLNSMEIGHRTEIEFIVRVYRSTSRFFRFLGNRIERKNSVSYVATRDIVDGTFTITKSNGQRIKIEDEESFFNMFFFADDIKIDMRSAERGEYYIMSRVEMKTIKLIPPLNLLSDIIPGIITKTDWIKVGTFRIE